MKASEFLLILNDLGTLDEQVDLDIVVVVNNTALRVEDIVQTDDSYQILTGKPPMNVQHFSDGVFAALADRTAAKAAHRCIIPPLGCGQPITPFRDNASAREYNVSALCQRCQDGIFSEDAK